MILQKIKKNKKGFVILFAVTLAAILLAVAVGITNIAQNEVRFGTLAKNTNDAFFAADVGAECALFYDKSTGSAFPLGGSAGSISCSPTVTSSGNTNPVTYDFVMTGLGPSSQGCAKVNVSKNNTGSAVITTVTSKGYNLGDASCNSANPIRVERLISITYSNTNSFSQPFVSAVSSFGASRNDFSGWVGMKFTTGGAPVTVTGLGRIMKAGDTGTHTVKLVLASTGTDVGSVPVNLSGGTSGAFVYSSLSASLVLPANTSYYLLSAEQSGGDTWYDYPTSVTTSSIATVDGPAFGDCTPYAGTYYCAGAVANVMYVPVDFLYSP